MTLSISVSDRRFCTLIRHSGSSFGRQFQAALYGRSLTQMFL